MPTGSAKAPKHPSRLGPRQAENDKFHNFKACNMCGETKRLADFAFQGHDWRKKRAADPTRYKARCKKCTRAPSATEVDPNFKPTRSPRRAYGTGTPATKRESAAKYRAGVRRASRIKSLQYLAEKGCQECGIRDPRVLEFDHLEPALKSSTVAVLLSNGYSWGSEQLRAEIRKCRVLCANCHRKHTIVQQDHYSHPEVKDALQQIYRDYSIG